MRWEGLKVGDRLKLVVDATGDPMLSGLRVGGTILSKESAEGESSVYVVALHRPIVGPLGTIDRFVLSLRAEGFVAAVISRSAVAHVVPVSEGRSPDPGGCLSRSCS